MNFILIIVCFLPPFLPGCELTDVIDCIENLGNWPLGPCN